ncbi:MAG: hypothetical protein U0527_12695 [Candidatus Eisenbacteria bacterium]
MAFTRPSPHLRAPRPLLHPAAGASHQNLIERHLTLILLLLAAILLALGLAATPAGAKGCEANAPSEILRCWTSSVNGADLPAIREMLASDFEARRVSSAGSAESRDRAGYLEELGRLFDPKQTVRYEVAFGDSTVVTERSLTRWKIDTIYLLAYTPRGEDGRGAAETRIRHRVSLYVQRAIEPSPHYEIYRWEEFGPTPMPTL